LAREYLPKLTIALLLVSIALVVVSAQPQVAARRTPSWYCNYYGNYNYTYYPYYYNYYPYDCYSYYYYYGYPYYYSNYYGYPYYSNYYSNYYSPTSYTLTVATDPSNLGTVTGGGSFTSGNSASFSVTQTTVQVSPDTRYVFSHWSGDYSGVGSSGSVTVNSAMKVTAVYQLQYLLTVNAQPQNAPVPQGAGWYNSGDTATLQSGGQTIGDSSSRLTFQSWSIDGQNTQPSPTLQVTMNAPHTVTAQYNQQYYLNVQTDQGSAYGTGWYDAGSTAQIYASTPVSSTYGVNIVFNGWQGDLQSGSQTASVVMDKPKNVIATWRTDPTVLYLTVAGIVIAVLLIVGGILVALTRGRTKTTQTQTTSTTNTGQEPSQPKTAPSEKQPSNSNNSA